MTHTETVSFLSALPTGTDASLIKRIKLVPIGKVKARDGRAFRIDDPEALLSATRKWHGSTDAVIDFDHQTDKANANGQPAPAAGWIKGFHALEDGIYADVEWTEKAARMIKDREYRYISPTFAFEKGTDQVRVIYRAALTNYPALEMASLAAKKPETHTMDVKDELRVLLGLSADSTDSDLVASARALVENSQTIEHANSQLAQLQSVSLELATEQIKTTKARMERKVDDAIRMGAILPTLRPWALQYAYADESGFDGFIKANGTPFKYLFTTAIPENALPGADPMEVNPEVSRIAKTLGVDPAKMK